MRVLACVTLAGVVAGAGAAPVPKDEGPKAAAYYPARKGDRWTYAGRISTSNVYIREFTAEATATAVESKGADTIMTIVRTLPTGATLPRDVVVVSTRGLDQTEDNGLKWSSPVPLLRLPPRPGDRVEVNATREDKLERSGEVTTHPAEEVETPSGKYQAVRSEFEGTVNGRTSRRTVWFATNVGIVKDVQSGEAFGRTTTVELVLKSFTPGKPAPSAGDSLRLDLPVPPNHEPQRRGAAVARKKKLLLGVGVAVVVVMVGWGLWSVRPLPTTTVKCRQGNYQVTETRTRSYQWMPGDTLRWEALRVGSCSGTFVGEPTVLVDQVHLGVLFITDEQALSYKDSRE